MPAEWTLLATADAETQTAEVLGAWLVTAVALGLGALGRRRLPIGIAEGLFVAGLSGLLLVNFVTWGSSAEAAFLQGAGLVSLTVVWFVVAVWVERDATPAAGEDLARRRAVRRDLAVHAAAVAGLLAVAVLLSAHRTVGILTPGLVLLLALLLVVAVGLYVRRRGALSRYAMVAMAALLLWLAVPREILESRRVRLSVGLLLAGLTVLLAVLAVVLSDWRRRVHIWHTDPARLTEPPPRHRRFFGLLVAACVAIGLGGMLLAGAVVTPLAVVPAAYAAFIVGHRWCSNAVGELGLVLAAESLITAGQAWLPASPACGLLGWAVAGVFMAWLARFWHQQLADGKPWTTAGRLIPAARSLSYAAAGGQLVVAAVWAWGANDVGASGRVATLLAAFFMFGHGWLLVRDATAQPSDIAALAACVVWVAAVVPIGQFAAACGLAVRPCVLLAAAGLALSLVLRWARPAARVGWPWSAYVGGLLPVAAAYDLAFGGWEATGWLGLAAVVVGVALALGVQRRRGLLAAGGVL